MRILVTAGPTREYLDTVRYLSNASTGRLGFAIATAAAARRHHVLLVTGPVDLPSPVGVELVRVVSAAEMLDVCVQRFPGCDAAIMTAAVCDYRPAQRLPYKLKKGRSALTLQLEPTADICATLGMSKGPRRVIGFALEDRDGHAHAQTKLQQKQCDAIVLNAPSNIASETAAIQVYHSDGRWDPPVSGSKDEIAGVLVDLLESLVPSRSA